jgi:adenine-specific DNA-methyltransferase
MTKKQKLELTWIGKDEVAKVEPRILIEDSELSYHASKRHSDADLFDNKLIFGDNLLALKALEQEYSGQVKCVFIDPPYNTGSAFAQYDDGIEHSLWLSLIRDRLELIKRLLSDDGSLWITIDDNEAHYLKVLSDEVFGRSNFVANVIWQKNYSERMDAKEFSASHDHLLVYKKTEKFKPNKLKVEQNDKQFNLYDETAKKFYRRRSLRKEGSNSLREDRPNLFYPIKTPDNLDLYPIKPSNNAEGNWRWSKDTFAKNQALGMVEWVKTLRGWEVYVKQYKEDDAVRPPNTLWLCEDVGHNHEAKEEVRAFNAVDVFSTPKPERLIKRILEIATVAGDIVLDSFAGSGTTGAVAHKLGRRWLMVELGDHCLTHVIPRLIKVIDGDDVGGITEAVNWKGGGGFRFYKLAPSLLAKDKWDNWVINKEYDANMLAAAVCKHEGFTYSPSENEWWAHGYSTEADFIYVTTQTLTEDQLLAISEDVGNDRTLLVCCSAFKASSNMLNDKLSNLTLKKMPHALLSKCEWGKDDYSLNISKLPVEEHDDLDEKLSPKKKITIKEADLFGEE